MKEKVKEINLLKNVPIFSCLHDHELEHLSQIASEKSYPPNVTLLHENDVTDSLYIILSGQVKTTKNDGSGKEIILSIFGPGEYFGEMAFIDGAPRSASVVAREQTHVWIFSRKDLGQLMENHPGIVFSLLQGLIERLRETNEKVENLAFRDVYGRIARFFMQLGVQDQEKLIIGERLTHQDIANMIGSSREMVSKILKELISGGYITIDNKMITIHKNLPYAF